MNESYDLPSEPRLSNTLYLSRPTPQFRSKMKQKKRLPPTPPDSLSVFLGLDDTVPLDDPNLPVIEHSSSSYVNQLHTAHHSDLDDFYVMPRQENLPSTDSSDLITNSSETNPPSTPPNMIDSAHIYATPPTFARNFVLESNLSFDDSQDIPSISLDSVPDLIAKASPDNSNYYSYPEQQASAQDTAKLVNTNDEKEKFMSRLNQVIKQQVNVHQQQLSKSIKREETKNYYSVEAFDDKQPLINSLVNEFAFTSINNGDIPSRPPEETIDYLEIIRENVSNCLCADCGCENPTVANMSWLLIICKACAKIHQSLTSDFLRCQSLLTKDCDPDLIDLIHDLGNDSSNHFLEKHLHHSLKPTAASTDDQREQYIRKKYLGKEYLQKFDHHQLTQTELDQMLYENVETTDYLKTLHLLMSGANPNYSQKMFAVADHAKRHQQIKQMKLILANGGLSEFDLMKTTSDEILHQPYETNVHLVTKHGILKECRTRYEHDRMKIFSISHSPEKFSQRYLFEIDLNNVLAICNQAVNSISLKSRPTSTPTIHSNSQCILIVDEQVSFNEYVWIFPNELERALWTRELLKRQYAFHQLIYSDFILLTKINVQEGINAEKQQVLALVYSGRFVICSDTIFDEVDLRKYSSLTYQKTPEFTGIVLCLVSNRFLYLSSPILKLTDMLHTCLRQATKVKTLTDLTGQILTSQNVPVLVERFINFIFEHGLESKGIYRQAGQETKIKQLLTEFLDDPFNNNLTRENYTEHDVANGLKRFLRQLEIPLLGTKPNYDAWLRSTVDSTRTTEQLIQYYRALLADLKQNYPIHYSTLRKMLLHIQSVSMLAERNAMTLSNLVSTFAPCIIAQPISTAPVNNYANDRRGISLDDLDMKCEENSSAFLDESQDSLGLLVNTSSPAKLKRNQSLQSSRSSFISSTSPSRFPLSSSYARVTPSIQADLEIMNHLCQYYRELFDVTEEELEHEKKCIEALISLRTNQCQPRKLNGTMVSVYFESRADELNGYAINILDEETTADNVIEKLLNQIQKSDCFFWALFEVIIDQNLERPMHSREQISTVLQRYRTCLPQELNRQATFVVKLNYVQFEKERLQQTSSAGQDFSSIECEYFDVHSKRWLNCFWMLNRTHLHTHRVSTEKALKWKARFTNSSASSNTLSRKESISEQQTPLFSWFIEDIFVYIGADRRYVNPFDMNEYRTLTILPSEANHESHFGVSFRFPDRHQMFAWYLQLVHLNGHDQWTRPASHTIPDGVNYLPLQNYHTPSSMSTPSRKKSEQIKTKLISRSSQVASTLTKQMKKS